MKPQPKPIKNNKNVLKNQLNVKFWWKRGKKLTFWHFSTATCEGVIFWKVKISWLVVPVWKLKRKFYMFDWCITDNFLLFKSFQLKAILQLKMLPNVKFQCKTAIFLTFWLFPPSTYEGRNFNPSKYSQMWKFC